MKQLLLRSMLTISFYGIWVMWLWRLDHVFMIDDNPAIWEALGLLLLLLPVIGILRSQLAPVIPILSIITPSGYSQVYVSATQQRIVHWAGYWVALLSWACYACWPLQRVLASTSPDIVPQLWRWEPNYLVTSIIRSLPINSVIPTPQKSN